MKTRFNSYDVACITAELQRLVGLRVNQIYDIDNKTYLIKLQEKDTKQTLLLESGTRFHTTSFEWPKNASPSGFSMKLRKHLKNKRLESLKQLGTDRIIDFQFGIGEATYHLILELYDRGNIVLCDWQMTILNVLRPHTEGETVRFVVREKYPESRARSNLDQRTIDVVRDAFKKVKTEDTLKRVLTPILDCGPTVLAHILTKHNLIDCKLKAIVEEGAETPVEPPSQQAKGNKKGQKGQKGGEQKVAGRYFDDNKDLRTLIDALNEADEIMKNVDKSRGYIIQKADMKPATVGGEPEEFRYNIEYHPYLFDQYRDFKYKEFDTFDASVDEFYSTLISQKIDMKTFNQECEALKKLSNVKRDHEKRLEELSKQQRLNRQRAELITRNQDLVNSIVMTIRGAVANQMSWADINEFVKSAQASKDNVASCIKQLKLETNHVSLLLKDPYAESSDDDDDDDNDNKDSDDDEDKLVPMVIDIDLGLSAYANATRFYDQKRNAAQKEHRTIESSAKALKNAEKRTQEHLKEVRTISNISKARKVFWFEKFFWFISSENYLVIGGRDQQQNELIVKRYLRQNDMYVHADIQGASSIVIRNHIVNNADGTPSTPPPKTLLEAGAMAISYSVAWDAKVTTSAYWVRADQVSKTAPSGEYLGTGSFMIRGKKNFLPPCHLILGLSIMFKLEDDSVARHANERSIRTFDNAEVQPLPDIEEDVDVPQDDAPTDSSALKPIQVDASGDDIVEFPDTHVNIGGAGSATVRFSSQISTELGSTVGNNDDNESDQENGAIIHAAAQQMPRKNRVIQKSREKSGSKKKQQQQKDNQKGKHHAKHIVDDNDDEDDGGKKPSSSQLKRGQKSKLKKIKEKYKDQDDEEKMMRMDILKSAGKKKEAEPEDDADGDDETQGMSKEEKAKLLEEKRLAFEKKQAENAALELDDDDGVPDPAENEMLNTLTGCPMEEDELLFALPVVAPYNALHNYKYKVKLTPGTARRGKTAKTALAIFLKEKSCTTHEKDLLKAVKHDLAARNMPGKVKLSAAQSQLQKLRN